MINNEYTLQRKLKRNNSALLGAFVIVLILVMVVLTCFFLPKTYGEIVSCKEIYPASGPFTFIVELGQDEHWHVKSWTDTEGTNYNVTLTGYPVLMEGSEVSILEDNCFIYKWTLSLNSSDTYHSYEFDLKMPSGSQNKWMFDLLIEGHGSIHITITKFDRHNFYMFFIPDLIGSLVLFVIIFLIIRQRKIAVNAEYERNWFFVRQPFL